MTGRSISTGLAGSDDEDLRAGQQRVDAGDVAEREGNVLVMKGKVFGSMPMTAKLTPQEAKCSQASEFQTRRVPADFPVPQVGQPCHGVRPILVEPPLRRGG